jgi:hypothetical protein
MWCIYFHRECNGIYQLPSCDSPREIQLLIYTLGIHAEYFFSLSSRTRDMMTLLDPGLYHAIVREFVPVVRRVTVCFQLNGRHLVGSPSVGVACNPIGRVGTHRPDDG